MKIMKMEETKGGFEGQDEGAGNTTGRGSLPSARLSVTNTRDSRNTMPRHSMMVTSHAAEIKEKLRNNLLNI